MKISGRLILLRDIEPSPRASTKKACQPTRLNDSTAPERFRESRTWTATAVHAHL